MHKRVCYFLVSVELPDEATPYQAQAYISEAIRNYHAIIPPLEKTRLLNENERLARLAWQGSPMANADPNGMEVLPAKPMKEK